MGRSPSDGYAFSEAIPVEPVALGSTVFVAGPAMSRADDLAKRLVADGHLTGDGALYISTNETGDRLLESFREIYADFDFDKTGVIDCSGQDVSDNDYSAEIKYVSTQSDLTGIGMKFSALYESLYMESGGPLRTGLVSLSSLSMYVDLRKLYQFVHTLSGRIDSADGLGVFSIDPTTHDKQTINTLSQVADGRIDVRESDEADGELKVRGMSGQPNGWQPFNLSD